MPRAISHTQDPESPVTAALQQLARPVLGEGLVNAPLDLDPCLNLKAPSDVLSTHLSHEDGRVLATLQSWSTSRLVLLAASLGAVIFAIDLATPTGVAAGVPYILPVALGLGSRDGRLTLVFAGVASALTTLGMVLSPHGGGPENYVLANRGLALFAIWITALGVRSELAVLNRLHQAHQELRHQESLARLGEMAAVVAHEVKNPIAGIMGVLQVLDSRKRPATEKRVLAEVRERLAGLARTVDDLHAFARPMLARPEPLDLRRLLEETRELVLATSQWSDLDVRVTGDPVMVLADRTQLGRAVLNLLLNAAAATEGTGTITASVLQRDDQAVLHIQDDGPGIPDHIRQRIFEPFFTTRTQGVGLGLPLVKQTITAHGGTIDIASPRNGGTLVTLALPASAR